VKASNRTKRILFCDVIRSYTTVATEWNAEG